MTTTNAVRYVHDCSCCQFLGQFEKFDLYFHEGCTESFIARGSDEGSDYACGLSSSFGRNPALTQARLRAEELGLFTLDPALLGRKSLPLEPPLTPGERGYVEPATCQ